MTLNYFFHLAFICVFACLIPSAFPRAQVDPISCTIGSPTDCKTYIESIIVNDSDFYKYIVDVCKDESLSCTTGLESAFEIAKTADDTILRSTRYTDRHRVDGNKGLVQRDILRVISKIQSLYSHTRPQVFKLSELSLEAGDLSFTVAIIDALMEAGEQSGMDFLAEQLKNEKASPAVKGEITHAFRIHYTTLTKPRIDQALLHANLPFPKPEEDPHYVKREIANPEPESPIEKKDDSHRRNRIDPNINQNQEGSQSHLYKYYLFFTFLQGLIMAFVFRKLGRSFKPILQGNQILQAVVLFGVLFIIEIVWKFKHIRDSAWTDFRSIVSDMWVVDFRWGAILPLFILGYFWSLSQKRTPLRFEKVLSFAIFFYLLQLMGVEIGTIFLGAMFSLLGVILFVSGGWHCC